MKILMVSPTPACPPTAGNRARILALSRAVRELGHDLHFAHLAPRADDAASATAHQREFGPGRFHPISLDRRDRLTHRLQPKWRALRGRLRVGNPYLYGLDEWYFRSYHLGLQQLDAVHGFDAVICEYVFMSRALDIFGTRTLKILDTHDAFGDRHLEFLKVGRAPQWYSTPKAEELRGFRRANVVIAIQPSEAARFAGDLGGAPPALHTVSHFLDLSRRAPASDAPAAAFIGSDNDINISALDHLTRELLPRILTRRPDFRLVVAGSICTRVADHPAILRLGRIDHVSDAFARAPIALNPTLFGTGINIKQLDAMAAGVPSVSTATGSRGFDAPERDGYIATVPDDDPQAFADAVIALIEDSPRRRAMAAAAFAAAQAWNARQTDALKSLLDAKSVVN